MLVFGPTCPYLQQAIVPRLLDARFGGSQRLSRCRNTQLTEDTALCGSIKLLFPPSAFSGHHSSSRSSSLPAGCFQMSHFEASAPVDEVLSLAPDLFS